jgi:hypothetical protein
MLEGVDSKIDVSVMIYGNYDVTCAERLWQARVGASGSWSQMDASTAALDHINGLCFPQEPTFRMLEKSMPSSYRLIYGHSMGSFFIMGQTITELFSLFDEGAFVAEATKLSRNAQSMRVTTLRPLHPLGKTYESARLRLLDPRPVLEVLVNNVYAEKCSFASSLPY